MKNSKGLVGLSSRDAHKAAAGQDASQFVADALVQAEARNAISGGSTRGGVACASHRGANGGIVTETFDPKP